MTFTPTPEQQAIIDTIRDEPTTSLMVKALAGSSKTTTITMASHVIGTSPCLAVAFNKRIAEELADKLPAEFHSKTLNALGMAAWRNGSGVSNIQVDADKLFKITKALVGKTSAEQKVQHYTFSAAKAEPVDGADDFTESLTLARAAKSAGLVPKGAPMMKTGLVPDTDEQWEELAFAKGFHATKTTVGFARKIVLESIKQAYSGIIDFDDQIYMSVLFGGKFPQYHTVIVDEAQDLSPLNHRMVLAMARTRLIVVGDPFQAIYAFRGADSSSMDNLKTLVEAKFGAPMKVLGLTYSFRAPRIISSRQRSHVPDFKSWETCVEGTLEQWPKPGVERVRTWNLSSIPEVGAILCRNNAPLMKVGFALIKQRRRVKILGRDIGASLAGLLGKITNKNNLPVANVYRLVDAWQIKELEKAGDAESKRDVILDRAECLFVLLEASGAATSHEAQDFIKDLFADKAEGLVLSSGHRSKGLEWNWVMHLDPWRVPSKFATPGTSAYEQELNLKYVIETRTKSTLVLASVGDCEEIGEH